MHNDDLDKKQQSFIAGKNPYAKRLNEINTADLNRTQKNFEMGILANSNIPGHISTNKILPPTNLLTNRLEANEFISRLNYEISRGLRYKRPLSLIMVSVDFLDNLLENWGEDTTYYLIENVYNKIASKLREIDLSGVYQSSILCFILPETNIRGATVVANRMAKLIAQSQFNHKLHTFNLSVSMGIAAVPDNANNAHELVDSTFIALQNAIQMYGGNQIVQAQAIRPK